MHVYVDSRPKCRHLPCQRPALGRMSSSCGVSSNWGNGCHSKPCLNRSQTLLANQHKRPNRTNPKNRKRHTADAQLTRCRAFSTSQHAGWEGIGPRSNRTQMYKVRARRRVRTGRRFGAPPSDLVNTQSKLSIRALVASCIVVNTLSYVFFHPCALYKLQSCALRLYS